MSDFTLPDQLFRAEHVRQLEELAIDVTGIASIQLMKRAGRVAFDALIQRWPNAESVRIVCGSGNNGGDGYVMAALAMRREMDVAVLSLCSPSALTGDAARAYRFAIQEGVRVVEVQDWSSAFLQEHTDIIVDALLGTGLKGELRAEVKAAIDAINGMGVPVVAVDMPSGLNGDTGGTLSAVIAATLTVTFVACKPGLLTGRGPQLCGEVVFDDLGLSKEGSQDALQAAWSTIQADCQRVTIHSTKLLLQARPADAHKGMFGHVLVIGGDTGYGGAVTLTAEACARSGAGLTSVATQPIHVNAILSRVPEAMVTGVASGQALEPLMAFPSVVAVGPGLGQSPWSEQMLQQAVQADLPLVVDADGLNIMAQGRVLPNAYRDNWVLTPHPGEAARLLGCSVEVIQNNRFLAVSELQKRYGGVVVLKGAGTVITDGHQLYLADVGNPGMASGGMGDVLAGVIAALMAQGLTALDAACLAVCVHGDAADLAAEEGGERGLLASDLIPYIRELLN
ncbi:bifunctional ADP-dependent NAD(P)H-hydrate dehydratase/NAD(P)H-hydrate epimerase [Teredinibacter purpureus]|uniref:bifunctional ADP-dependent NAD(P)H-hydrate dehydratase/NAD(P)H-hydrate epimerase n=1 Tax=Teredinibacter purpureus TaxID=2731756 RepID=UPI0005F785C6|nr:bifunctional ADP-dependent NAD(P)H-hydrate dehydratase/NAD(P)H-hydrate epimerase [Teredinibacter purpureus]